MEDTSSASSDSDNALLSPQNHPRIGCTVSTQTPEMPRHEISVPDPTHSTDLNSSIMVYKLDTQKSMAELEKEARTLSIPDVVVEYIKESYRREDDGNSNPAFESQELIVVRTPSSVSLREDAAQSDNGMALLPMAKENATLQHTVPRQARMLGDGLANTNRTSGFLNVMDPVIMGSQISLGGFPRSVPPSPNFGYRPLESESSAVYTIISPVRYMGNGGDKEAEMRLLAQLQAQLEKEKSSARKFEFCPSPPEVDRRRHRLQCATDICSTLFLIPGILIAIVTPISLIPMFLLPLKYYIPLIAVFVLSGITAVLSLAVSGFLGNIVWHYDDKTQKLRPRLHCGTGPLRHFWGNGFYPEYSAKLVPEKV